MYRPWRRNPNFWLFVLPVAALAAALLVMRIWGLSGGDDPAHLYKIALLKRGQSVLWDNYWYGGSYGAVTYGVVYYWLAQFVPPPVLTVLSGGLLPGLFCVYLQRAWAVRDRAAAATLGAVLVVYLAWGQSPFLFALCLTMGGLVLLAAGHPLAAAVPCGVAVFTNPLAIVAGAVFLLAMVLAHREARRPGLIFAGVMLPVVTVRVLFEAVFAAPSWEFHYAAEIGGVTAVALVGIFLARRNADPERRHLWWVFASLLAIVVPAYVLPESPLGSNAARFFYVFGAPLLVAVARRSLLPRLLPLLAVVLSLVFQLAFPVWLLARAPSFTATRADFFAPALDYAARVYDPNYRFHVVTPEMHWESYYFPTAGYPITRGWFRQADALHNSKLYDEAMTPSEYTQWLRRMGVQYVFVPEAPLVSASRREAAILASSTAFVVAYRHPLWTVYQLKRPQPLVVPLRRAKATVFSMGHTSIRFGVSRRGAYLVKVTYSPYWRVGRRSTDPALRGRSGVRDGEWEADGSSSGVGLHTDPYGFMVFEAPRAGVYSLRFDLARAAHEELRP